MNVVFTSCNEQMLLTPPLQEKSLKCSCEAAAAHDSKDTLHFLFISFKDNLLYFYQSNTSKHVEQKLSCVSFSNVVQFLLF